MEVQYIVFIKCHILNSTSQWKAQPLFFLIQWPEGDKVHLQGSYFSSFPDEAVIVLWAS